MFAADVRDHDLRRLAALQSYRVLDTAAADTFARFTRLAASLLDAEAAAISFVEASGVANEDLDAQPAEISLASPAQAAFYAVTPLAAPGGLAFGALYVWDRRPREISPKQIAAFADLAAGLMFTLELLRTNEQTRALALTDALTGLPNRMQFYNVLTAAVASMVRSKQPLSLLYLDCDDFKRVNDLRGHQAGDDYLRLLGQSLRELVRASDTPARWGGDEFVVALPATGPRAAQALSRRLMEHVATDPRMAHFAATLSIGAVTFLAAPASADAALALGDTAMYQAKARGKNQLVATVIGGAGQSGADRGDEPGPLTSFGVITGSAGSRP